MRVRRSPHLVAHWRRGRLIATNYATRSTASVDPFILQILDMCETWTSVRQLRSSLDVPPDSSLQSLLDRLVELELLEREGQRTDPRVTAMSTLGPWNPEAGFFHTASRDVAFATARQAARFAAQQAKRWPMPPVVKEYRRCEGHRASDAAHGRRISDRASGASDMASILVEADHARGSGDFARTHLGRAAVGRGEAAQPRAQDVAVGRRSSLHRDLRRDSRRGKGCALGSITTRRIATRWKRYAARCR